MSEWQGPAAQNGFEFIRGAPRRQTSAGFLLRMGRDPDRLRLLLAGASGEEPSQQDLTEFRQWLRRRYWVATLNKWLNTGLFYSALIALVFGTFWQLANLLIRDWFDFDLPALILDDFRGLNPPELVAEQIKYPTISSLIESFILIVLGGGLLLLYKPFKRRQTRTEDQMRLTLFAPETLPQKRLWLSGTHGHDRSGAPRTRRPAAQLVAQASDEAWLAKQLQEVTNGAPARGQTLAILAQLKDAGIKVFSYNLIANSCLAAGVACVLIGFFWTYIAPHIANLTDPTAIGTIQSVFMVGGGGLCFSTRRQYRRRRDQLTDAMEMTLYRHELLVNKSARLIDALRTVDTGLEQS